MYCSLSGSYVHGIFQARVLEWIAISFSRGSSQPRNRTRVSHLAGQTLCRLSHQGSPKLLKVMSNQWCNTRLEKPSCTSKPWKDTWWPKGRTQQVSSCPSSALLGSTPHTPRRRHVSYPAPLTCPGAGVCLMPRPSLWHSSDTNGWGVSSLLRRKWFYSQFPKPRLGRCGRLLETWGTFLFIRFCC